MKSKLRKLADGGSPNPSMLGTGAAARAGGLLAGRGRQIDDAVDAAAGAPAPDRATAPAPAPQQAAQAPKKSGLRSMFGFADGGTYLDDGYNVNRYQQSQLKDGGRVKGPGGRTDDKVGPVMLSDEEYVLPGDTADAIGRDKLDAIRLATHEFKDKRKESALRGRVDGGDGWYDDMMPMDHLADGGNPWIVDSKGNVRTNSFGDAAAGPGYQQPRLHPPQPGTAVQVAQPPMGQRPPIDITPRGSRTPPAAQVVDAVTDVTAKTPWTRAGNMVKSALRSGAPVAGIAGAAQSFDDQSTGYRDHFQNSVGAESPLGSVVADAARVLSNVGDAATFGLAGRIGRGLSGIGNEGFINGFMSPSDRDQYLQQRTQQTMGAGAPSAAHPSPVAAATSALRSDQGPAQPVTRGSYQSLRLSEMGVPLDVQNGKPVVDLVTGNPREFLRTGGTSQYQNLGTYGGDANIYGKADGPSRPGRINNFVGVGAGVNPENGSGAYGAVQSALRGLGSGSTAPGGPNSDDADVRRQIDSVNKRYDDMLRNGRGRNVEFGSDWSQRHGISLETARGRELADITNNARTNDTSRANTQLSADTLRDNAQLNARTSLLHTLGQVENDRATTSARAQAAQLRVLQEAQKYADGRQDKGEAATNDWIKRRFTSSGPNNSQVFDSSGAAEFTDYLGSGKVMVGPPENRRPLLSLSPQERLAALPEVYQDWVVSEAINSDGGLFGGERTSNSPSNLIVRPPNIADLANGLPVSEYLGAKFVPKYESNVVERKSDRKVRSVEAIAGDDLERKKAILRNASKE